MPEDLWWKGRRIAAAVTGTITVAGHLVTLKVGLSESFPLCLPEIAVAAIKPSVQLPHVDEDGKLCFESDDGLLIDQHEPHSVLGEAMVLARATLERALTGNRAAEFAQEIVAHWRRLCPEKRIALECIIEAGDAAHATTALVRNSHLCAIADTPETLAHSVGSRSTESLTHRNAIYIPISPAADPAFVPRDLLDAGTLRRLVRQCDAKEWKRRERLLRDLTKDNEIVVLGVERPDGERALVGVNLRGLNGPHPLLEDGPTTVKVLPEELSRRDLKYLAPRGGADGTLATRNVLLAGCGAVGGSIAVALARAGVGNLTLVDPDRFEMENTYRHVCGMAYVGKPKVVGLKAEIERLVPYVQVTAHEERLERLVAQSDGLLRKFDLVVSALGSPTVELWLNSQLWSERHGPPAIFVWLEPLGLGGHALITKPSSEPSAPRGCFECLHARQAGEGPLVNRAAFAMPGVRYSRDVLGCGSHHLPFGSLDAEQIATWTTRLAVNALRGTIARPTLLSWKGDASAFLAAKYAVTARHACSQAELDSQSKEFARSDCLACSA